MRGQSDSFQLKRGFAGLKTLDGASQSSGVPLRVPWLVQLVPTSSESEHAREQASFGSVKASLRAQGLVGTP